MAYVPGTRLPDPVQIEAGMFRLLPFFSMIGLLSIVVTAVLLTLFYRQVTIQTTVDLEQASNRALARSTLLAARHETDDFLATATSVGPQEAAARGLAARLDEILTDVMRDALVVRAKLYNRRGIVVFSTDRMQLGDNQANNPGFAEAFQGRSASHLIYRDRFNSFDGATEDANLLQTSVPVRSGSTGPVTGVFEIYTDVTPMVAQNERAVFIILGGLGLLLLLLCAVLFLVVRRARNVIQSLQRSASERSAALETLSARMLSSEEIEKKKLALGLHEGIAQTLNAVRFQLEESLKRAAEPKAGVRPLASVIPALQNAIKDVQAIATGLRPSSLDELGLLPTIDWLCRELEHRHPDIRIDDDVSIGEKETPGPLKIVIYRIIESTFRNIASYENTDRIRLALRLADGAISLVVDDTPRDSRYTPSAARQADSDLQLQFAEAQERTTLSGGTFSVARNKAGGFTLHASWRA